VFESIGFFVLGFIASILAMTSGGEGAIIFVTAFTWIGLDPRVSVGTAFVTQFFGKSAGTFSWWSVGIYEKDQVVVWRKLAPLFAICISFVIIGMVLIKHLPGDLIKFIFGIVCIILAYFMIGTRRSWKRKDFPWRKLLKWKEFCCLLLAGLFTGLIAVGAGALTMYVIHCRRHLDLRRAVATVVAFLPIITIIGVPIYWPLVNWEVANFTIVGVIVGGAAGPWISTWLKKTDRTEWIKNIFIGLTLTMGIGMLASSVLSMV